MTTKELLTSALLLILLCNSPVLSQTAIDNSHNDYIYDNASRLVSSSYTSGSNSNRYNTQYSYDCMGNITSLSRNGLLDDGSYGLIDDLTLTYDGNQLMAVSDDGDDPSYNNAWNFMDGSDSEIEYEYDANGNVTKDLNRNILSIQYNSLNLPSVIEFVGGKTIKYTYSADGHKLRAVYTTVTPATTKQIDYCGNLIFENGQLKQMLFEGGYIPMDDMSGAYCFYVKDHLGNNRMVVHPSGTVEQVNNYYPYGGLMSNSTGWNTQRYKYNGKEFDRMHGLDWYDYGARWMDAAIGRWHVMDPLCEKYYDVSPYNYCRNNPILYFDKNGCEGEGFLTKFGDSFQNVGLAAAAFGTATIIISAEAEIATLGVSSIPSVVGVSSGAAAIIAGSVTYTIGSAMKITERIMQNASSQGKKSVDSGKNERHGDGGRAMNRPSTAKQIKDLDAQIKNAKNKKERQRLEKKQDNIKREAQRKKHGEEHSRGSKR